MDAQSLATASLLLPALVFGIVAWRARSRGMTTLGLGLRDGTVREILWGLIFGGVSIGVLFGIFFATRMIRIDGFNTDLLPLAGIILYFAVLFLIEEIVFRGLLMTGLGVTLGRWPALLITSVLVALPYSFSAGAGILAVLGAVIVNLGNGAARWRTGRIWFGWGMRLAWNGGIVALGFTASGYDLAIPVIEQYLTAPDIFTGGQYGPEGGVIGMTVRLAMFAVLMWFISVRHAPWTAKKSRTSREK